MNHDPTSNKKEISIKADLLTKRYGDFIAANALSFEVYKGEIFGFLGANGAGKTTAMRMLCSLFFGNASSASTGTCRFNEKSPTTRGDQMMLSCNHPAQESQWNV